MPASRLPLDIKNFLNDVIESVTHLEILLMLYSHPESSFNATRISRELRTNTRSTEAHLKHLSERGLLIYEEDSYRYRPNSDELHKKVIRVYELYKEKPVSVVAAIFERPQDKLKDFSDAFKLKKD